MDDDVLIYPRGRSVIVECVYCKETKCVSPYAHRQNRQIDLFRLQHSLCKLAKERADKTLESLRKEPLWSLKKS